jgi:hypothetical protein
MTASHLNKKPTPRGALMLFAVLFTVNPDQ